MAYYSSKVGSTSKMKSPVISNVDTVLGITEILKAGDDKFAKLFGHEPNPPGEEKDDKEDEYEYFDDFQMDVGFRFRERPLMLARLEKIDQEKKKRAKMKNIKWETSKEPLSQEELDDLFPRKEINVDKIKNTNCKSKLAELIQNHSSISENPYAKYGQFDGSWQYTVPVKVYKIYITMLPPEQRNYPMEVCCVASATINELIGFILYKYSLQYGATNLLPVSYYNLYITEDDGEVDTDLPCLDRREPSSKFGFTYLGLVQEEQPCDTDSSPEVVYHTMSIQEQIEQNKPRRDIDKEQAEEELRMENDIKAIERNNKLMEAPLFRLFRVFMKTRFKLKIDINIGISWQRIEIDPIPQKIPKLMPFKQKAICYPMDSVVCCYITEKKSNKVHFRIVYCTDDISSRSSSPAGGLSSLFTAASSLPRSLKFWSNFKHCDFEADVASGEEIVSKIESILELKSSTRITDYKLSRQFNKRKSYTPTC